jgi:AcrR family transcriptional regulator
MKTMSKGEVTRQAIVERAMNLATRIGLEGLTIGGLAEAMHLSKSGLFAHFKSKEALQRDVLRLAADRFVEAVIRPALTAPRGEPRLRALFENWMSWPQRGGTDAGCFFVAAAAELDDRPGPVRDLLVQQQKDWMETIATVVRTGISEGHFRRDVDADQMAHDLYGVMLAYHHATRLLTDPNAPKRAKNAFETLVAAARGAKIYRL